MRFIAVASAFLITALFTAPPASATLVGETVETVRSTVKSVQGAVNEPPAPSAPSAPSAAPAATTPPPAPAPPAPVKAPLDRASAPSSAGSGSDAPSADGVTGAAGDAVKNVVGSVTGAAAETVKRAPAPSGGSLPGGGGQVLGLEREDHASAPDAGPDAVGASSSATEAGAHEARRAGDIAPSTSLSVTAGKVVALRRWIARIWPGIPLIGRGPAARAIEAGLLEPAATTAGQLLFAAALATAAVGDSPLATDDPPAAKDRYTDLLGVMSTDWKKALYWIALGVLLALLAFAVWRDFQPALRPRVR